MRAMMAALLLPVAGLAGCGNVYHERPSPYVSNRIAEGKRAYEAGDREAALAQYETAAALGDPFGEYKAAQLYAGGPPEARDEERAVELLRTTLEKRSAVEGDAQALLGRILADEDPAEALALLREADAGGADVPPGEMARLLIEQGYEEEAEPWLAEGRAEGDIIALRLSIDRALAAGDRARAERYALQLAQVYRSLVEGEGKVWAAWLLARLYDDGEALPRDVARAIRWYEVAAEAGEVRAMRRLARGHLQGHDGFPVDAAAGLEWGERGVAAGDVASTAYLGRALLTGNPVRQDVLRGAELLEAAAAAGHGAAMTDLGRAYVGGDPLPQDTDRGLALLEAAGADDNASALTTLGWLYWNGETVSEDRERARGLMERAAALGHPSAQRFMELYG